MQYFLRHDQKAFAPISALATKRHI